MNNTIQELMNRKSVRVFTREPISKEMSRSVEVYLKSFIKS